MTLDLRTLARALGGVVSNGQVLCPGPKHSPSDRSLSIKLAGTLDGFIVHSFSNDDPIICRDYVREKLGLAAFKPNGNAARRRVSDDVIARTVMAAACAAPQHQSSKIVATYDYTDENGALLYQVVRLEPKDFRQRQPDGQDGWIWKLVERRVLYRWPELQKYPDATVFITEGEKDADRVAALGHCATTVATGKWTSVKALADRDVIILEDNDDAGRKKATEAAQALNGTVKSIRIVALPDLPEKGDVSDWLDADTKRASKLVETCFNAPVWTQEKNQKLLRMIT
jgi:5S rRNA maturation endonuclease (ribonuclease M5)